ncbi:MAG: M20/M25/M40 family metallo-hydrolase [Planctomycetes bacterium]|nr:M20/M25/M40 family metallo-hydrolase [Planctomycetota bacterium]
MKRELGLLASLVLFPACRSAAELDGLRSGPRVDHSGALALIDEAQFVRHVAVLASDEFEGRAPGTSGEERTVAYLCEQFRALGLAPGNPDGTFVQDVPLVGFRAEPKATLWSPAGKRELAFPDDYVAVSRRTQPSIALDDLELVFVGYGVVAPEFGWDDYKGVDVRGKALVMLVGDPPVPSASDASKLDDALFQGRAMTYYGRWTYKYEIASEMGAAMAILVHETGPAGYPYEVVSGSWSRENFDIARSDGNAQRVAVESWIRDGVARQLFTDCGLDFDGLKARAATRDFRPTPLPGAQLDVTLKNTLREVRSRNVIAKLPGRGRADEAVVYTAHWDHLGRDSARAGDQIFNGALDNATGVAGLLEIAQAFRALEPAPERTLLFLAVTAEEKGLLGSRYYAEHPLHPLEKTLACINMDGVNVWGRTRDVASSGYGNSTLHDVLAQALRAQGRELVPDDEPEKGSFFRSDHFEFAKRGVPGLHAGSGKDYLDRPAGWGQRMSDEYVANDYHKPSDELRAEWEVSGALEDLRAFFSVGVELARTEVWPSWSAQSEFKAVREAALR